FSSRRRHTRFSRDWSSDVCSSDLKNIISFGGFKNHFALWFYNGVFLKDPYKVLVSAQERTKALRQWRFHSMDEIDEKIILEYIRSEERRVGKESRTQA